ncbi:hypothetical protein DITRI_Ditri17bG0120600 [Diplodiscus trichospermus]
MALINHFLHNHPLVLTKEAEINNEVVCTGCCNHLADPFYGCRDCKFYLHQSCAELPRGIQNFSHPCPLVLHILSYRCNACFKHGSGFSYYCQRCNFHMHVKCTQRPTMESGGEEVIHHFTHQHPLTLVDLKKDLEVRCAICVKLCSDSSDSYAYGCQGCNFFLHYSCMITIPRQINHFFHPSCPLTLLTDVPYKCKGCDEHGSGLAFRCGKCHFYLDVKCALLPTVESKGADKIQHYAHGHPLVLRESNEFGIKVQCRACGENCSGPCFGCERCSFFLHRQCAVRSLPETEIHHPFHPQHPLTLSALTPGRDRTNFRCRACGGNDDRFLLTYRCAKCDFNLHTVCATPKLKPLLLRYAGHSHFLMFFNRTRGPFSCSICGCYARNCFFRCVACGFNIHLSCFPSAPKTIKYKCHLHPLTLTESPLEFELNTPGDKYSSEDEFYCDVCEEKRYRFEPVYYCEECKFIAEIGCVMSELLPSLTTSPDDVTLHGGAISKDEENSAFETAIAEINNEIAALTVKKKPLEEEIERHRAILQALEEEIEPIKSRVEQLETDHLHYKYMLNLNRNENKHPN